jgi:hypothetical protein
LGKYLSATRRSLRQPVMEAMLLAIPWLFLVAWVVNAVAMIAFPVRWAAMHRKVYGDRSNIPKMGDTASGRRQIRVPGCAFLPGGLVMIRGLILGMRQG